MMKILISDKLAQEGIDILTGVDSFEVDCQFGIKPEKLKSIIKDYAALIIRSGTKVTADIIEAADNLKYIGRAGVGVDNVDLRAATRKGVVVMNTPGGNTTATAEQTMSLILALSRNIPQAHSSVRQGKWERSKFTGVELHGKTLGIIGLGRIGSTVARMAKGFNMHIVAHDPYISTEIAERMSIELVEFDELLARADYITLHVPKSSETSSLISEKEFAKMKKGVRIINCARGGIIDEGALYKALEEGRVAGCALDVYSKEPPPPDFPLFKFDNCITTPHLGAATSEAQINVAIEIAETVKNALLGKGVVNAVNFPSLDAASFKVLEPYIDLAEKMGKFAGQLISGGIRSIRIVYSGDMNNYKVTPITMSLVYGLLVPILGRETINPINALDLAKERGVKVQEIKSNEEREFVNLVDVEIETDKETFSIWGTLSGNNQPRIVKINGVYVEAKPEGYMLFINNNDRRGIVGAVGTILAKADINIGGITFGREFQGSRVTCVVNVDSPVPKNAIEELEKVEDIVLVKPVCV